MTSKGLADTLLGYWRYLRSAGVSKFTHGRKCSNEKHLLLLAWEFPPVISGGVYRPMSFVREGVRRGWKVTVAAGPVPSSTSAVGSYLISQLPAEVAIIRVRASSLTPSSRFFPHIDGGFVNISETLDAVLRATPSGVSAVLATGPMFHNFVAAEHLATHYKAPLILDYRDEWSDCPFAFVRKGNMDRYWEHYCLKRAHRVLFVTQSFAKQSQCSFPDVDASKFLVIPNGFELSDVINRPEIPAQSPIDRAVTIAFLGNLSRHCPPDSLLNTLHDLFVKDPHLGHRINLLFVGAVRPAIKTFMQRHSLSHSIVFRDQVTKPEAFQIMKRADGLLLINPPELHRYLPGKLFDYLAADTPILVYGEGGEVAEVVKRLDAGYVVPTADRQTLHDALLQIKGGKKQPATDLRVDWLRRHERSLIAENLFTQIESITISPRHVCNSARDVLREPGP